MNNSTKNHEELLIEEIEKNLPLYTKTELMKRRTELKQIEERENLNKSQMNQKQTQLNGSLEFSNLTKEENLELSKENSQNFTSVASYNLKPKVYQKKLERNNINNNGYVDKLLITLLVGFAGGVIATTIYIFINIGKFTFTF